jgi:transmembrane sensor
MTSELAHIASTPLEISADWFARKRSGQMSAHELREMQAWLDADVAHDAAFRRIAQTWELTRAIASDPEILAIREEARNRHPVRTRILKMAGMSLALLIVLGVTGWFATSTAFFQDLFTKPYVEQFRTAVGEIKTIKLPDGSIVSLDTDTVMRVRETAAKRSVTLLRGQALFHVAKDASRPFVVSAGGNDVTAVGTVFDVRVEPNRFKVTLVEGRIFVAPPGTASDDQRTAMVAGWQLTTWKNGERTLSPVNVTAEAHELGWLDGRLTFIATPIGAVAAEMNRYSTQKIVVDPPVSEIPIDGVFRTGDVAGFVKLVTAYGFARVLSDTETEIVLGAPRKSSHRR